MIYSVAEQKAAKVSISFYFLSFFLSLSRFRFLLPPRLFLVYLSSLFLKFIVARSFIYDHDPSVLLLLLLGRQEIWTDESAFHMQMDPQLCADWQVGHKRRKRPSLERVAAVMGANPRDEGVDWEDDGWPSSPASPSIDADE